MTTHNQPSPMPGDWSPLPTGEIARLGSRLRRRQSRRTFLRASATVASVLAAGGAAWFILGRRKDGPYDFGGITCGEVVRQGKEYMQGKVAEPVRTRIAEHVARCPRCGPLFERMRDQMERM